MVQKEREVSLACSLPPSCLLGFYLKYRKLSVYGCAGCPQDQSRPLHLTWGGHVYNAKGRETLGLPAGTHWADPFVSVSPAAGQGPGFL